MSSIMISVASKCDKGGREANQDNGWLCPDLSRPNEGVTGTDKNYPLSAYGSLMVVADGMGGMKSGEVASQIVIDTIRESFSMIPSAVTRNPRAIAEFMGKAIRQADKNVKEYSAAHPESQGMGSTLVMTWVVGGKVYVAWCGDSRAYCFNPVNGLARLTHDHSYVQSLADNGIISEEEMFNHPQGNIITHSIGDTEDEVHFDLVSYPIHNGDILLLCSDGLCGLLDDKEISTILSQNTASMNSALAALWNAGEKRGWSDNVTIELMAIKASGLAPETKPSGWRELYGPQPDPEIVVDDTNSQDVLEEEEAPAPVTIAPETTDKKKPAKKSGRGLKSLLIILCLIIIAAGGVIFYVKTSEPKEPEITVNTDENGDEDEPFKKDTTDVKINTEGEDTPDMENTQGATNGQSNSGSNNSSNSNSNSNSNNAPSATTSPNAASGLNEPDINYQAPQEQPQYSPVGSEGERGTNYPIPPTDD